MHTIWGACAFGIGTQGVVGMGNGVGIQYGVLVMGKGECRATPVGLCLASLLQAI